MPFARTAALLFALALASAPALAQAPRNLTIGAQTAPTSLDPHYHNSAFNIATLRQVYDALFEITNRGELRPGLAEALHAIDDLTWEIRLRPGVRFHDGTPFGADDVAWSFARIPNVPNSPSLFTSSTQLISSVEVTGPNTLVMRTRVPNPLMPFDLATPMILSSRVHGAGGANAPTPEFNTGRLAVGTGAYRVVAYVPGERLELARNDTYWGAAPPWQRVTLRFVASPGPRLAALLTGEVDLIDNVAVQDMPRLSGDPRFRLFAVDGTNVVYLALDSSREASPFVADRQGRPLARNPLADRRVREALSLAIPRPAIVERLYNGQATAADQFAAPVAEYRLEGLPPLAFDAARARALLAEAGYPDGFRLTVHGPNGLFVLDGPLLQAIAQGFTRIGVETQVQVLPVATLSTRATNREFSAFMTFFGSLFAINLIRQVAMTRDPGQGFGSFNRTRYSNPALDAPAARALATMDPDLRRALTGQAAMALLEDKGVIPVLVLRNTWAARRDAVVYDPSPFNHTSALHARPAQ